MSGYGFQVRCKIRGQHPFGKEKIAIFSLTINYYNYAQCNKIMLLYLKLKSYWLQKKNRSNFNKNETTF